MWVAVTQWESFLSYLIQSHNTHITEEISFWKMENIKISVYLENTKQVKSLVGNAKWCDNTFIWNFLDGLIMFFQLL